ncbi:NAD(P)-binding protein [Arthrobacter sp. Bi26]|uniref:FAD-dependent oxidoreductase n=1 Tax=Arthrobacter sp. Bi26 TaxID=2822350 RepID=UPI0033BBB378
MTEPAPPDPGRQAVSVIGGGIAGLALAARLDPARFDVTVHEQRDGLPTVGTSLAVWPAAQRALGRLGILDAVREASPVIEGMSVRAASGKPWTAAQAPGLIGVSRVDLIRLLDAAVPVSVGRASGRIDIVRPGPAGLVVGSDGVHSSVRAAAGAPAPGRGPHRISRSAAWFPGGCGAGTRANTGAAGSCSGLVPRRPGPTGTRRSAPGHVPGAWMSPPPWQKHAPATQATHRGSSRSWPRQYRRHPWCSGSGRRRRFAATSAEG